MVRLTYHDLIRGIRRHIQNLWDGEYTTEAEYLARRHVIGEIFADSPHDEYNIPLDNVTIMAVRRYIASYTRIVSWIEECVWHRFNLDVETSAVVEVILDFEVDDERIREQLRRTQWAAEEERRQLERAIEETAAGERVRREAERREQQLQDDRYRQPFEEETHPEDDNSFEHNESEDDEVEDDYYDEDRVANDPFEYHTGNQRW